MLTAGSRRSSGRVLNIVGPATANARRQSYVDTASGVTSYLSYQSTDKFVLNEFIEAQDYYSSYDDKLHFCQGVRGLMKCSLVISRLTCRPQNLTLTQILTPTATPNPYHVHGEYN